MPPPSMEKLYSRKPVPVPKRLEMVDVGFSLARKSRFFIQLSKRSVTQKGQEHSALGICGHLHPMLAWHTAGAQ